MNIPGVNCAWTYGGPTISQAVLIFQEKTSSGEPCISATTCLGVGGGGGGVGIQLI